MEQPKRKKNAADSRSSPSLVLRSMSAFGLMAGRNLYSVIPLDEEHRKRRLNKVEDLRMPPEEPARPITMQTLT